MLPFTAWASGPAPRFQIGAGRLPSGKKRSFAVPSDPPAQKLPGFGIEKVPALPGVERNRLPRQGEVGGIPVMAPDVREGQAGDAGTACRRRRLLRA